MNKDSADYSLYFNSLKKSVIFSEISDDLIHELLRVFGSEIWSKGDTFGGEKTRYTFYFIISGRVKMYRNHPNNGNEFILHINSPGDIFDVICLLDNKQHDIQIEALDTVTLLAAPIETVRDWILQHPNFNKVFLPYLAEKFRKMEEKASDLALFDTWTRTLKLFIKHAKENLHDSEFKLINNLSHSEIAKIIGTSKNVINRHIQRLKNDKILNVNRKNIEIKNLEGLLKKLRQQN